MAGAEDRPLSILLLEDSAIDAELIETHLANSRFVFTMVRVSDREGFLAAIGQYPDVVLADYSLPGFDGLSALEISKEVAPDVPFIFVSGVVGEEFATSALQQGAVDYVTKRNLRRLPTAVARAVAERQERAERRKAEAALRASEISSRLALQAARLGSWDFDLVDNRLMIDARAADLLGLQRPGEISYDEAARTVHLEDRDRIAKNLADAIAAIADGAFEQEYRVVAGPDSERWIDCRGQVVFENGQAVRVVGVLRDVTEQKRAEREMLQRNATLAADVEERTEERDRIWRHSHDLLAVAGLDGRLRSINPAWTELLGHAENTLLATPLLQLVHPEDQDALRAAREAMRTEGTTQRFESRLRRDDGEHVWISWTVVPVGSVVYAIGRDVSDERQAARELEAANSQLRDQIGERERAETALRQMQRLEAVGQLTSGVAHDFNNLLTVVLGNLIFIERDVGDADAKLKRRLSHIRTAAERGAALTGQLLSFARRQRLDPRSVELNDTVAAMHDLLSTTMGGTVSVTADLAEGLWPALVDANQIELVILNLAINARDAMPGGGELTISTQNVVLPVASSDADLPAGDYVLLAVSDTGTGMSQEVLARALEPFFTTKEVGKGSGLGLAQVYGFAKQSGGGVHISTRPGQGTTVYVYLPRALHADRPDGDVVPSDDGDTVDDRSILLVDDDPAVRDVTAALLRERGFEVVEAASGQQALETLAQRDGFDLLLVDYAMPGMTGGDVVRAARKTLPDLPVLFLTGYADLADLQSFVGDRVVQKPFEPGHLVAEIQKSLPRRS